MLTDPVPGPTNRHIQRLDRITNGLLALIVFIPFVISAGALTGMARSHGIPLPWLYPFMIDGGLVIFKAQALRASLRGRRDGYSWTMATLLTAISVLLNVLHVPPDVAERGLAMLMAALPPLLILTAFIGVSRRVEEAAQEAAAVTTHDNLMAAIATKTSELNRLEATRLAEIDHHVAEKVAALDGVVAEKEAQLDRLQAELAALAVSATTGQTAVSRRNAMSNGAATDVNGIGSPVTDDRDSRDTLTPRQRQILAYQRQGWETADIAQALGVSTRTVYRDMQQLPHPDASDKDVTRQTEE